MSWAMSKSAVTAKQIVMGIQERWIRTIAVLMSRLI